MKWGGERTSSFHGHNTRELCFQTLGNRMTPALRAESFIPLILCSRRQDPILPALFPRRTRLHLLPHARARDFLRLLLIPHPALAARSSAMDSNRSFRRRGKGEKGRGGSRLGLKTMYSPTPPALPAASFSSPPPTFLSAPLGPPSSSLAHRAPAAVAAVPASSPTPSTAASSSSLVGRASSPLQGNQHAPNLCGVRPEPTRGSRQELANHQQGAAAAAREASAAELAELDGGGRQESEEQLGKFLVLRLYEALNSGDARRAQELLAPDLEWWFHGPPAHQHMMRLLTGADHGRARFLFSPRSVDAFGSTVIAEGGYDASQLYWVHPWTVGPDGVITQLREYFNMRPDRGRLNPSG
ncbi:hypothetical protein GUJ93_ZPchr0013g35196 [Zizania palustris]|uniref:Uncharacterized protein n=1 Tax=Zizania palustris TaxID=103762 RepID=A0A8J5WRK5_ZIZPA|nr:hypothetical protein GUJ93_ZPchr0013g35196 [Zizania palustris]